MQKKWTAEDVERLQLLSREVISLNTPIYNEWGDDMEMEIQDAIADESPSPIDLVEQQDTREMLCKIIKRCLTEREQFVIVKRFGLDDDIPYTLEELGKEIGICRERIRQIEARALRKLRANMVRAHLKSEDF